MCPEWTRRKWSGRRDSNPRPSGPKPDALPGCATPRPVPLKPPRMTRLVTCRLRAKAGSRDYPTAQPPRAHTLARTHRKAINASTPPSQPDVAAFVCSTNAQQQPADPDKSAEKCRVANGVYSKLPDLGSNEVAEFIRQARTCHRSGLSASRSTCRAVRLPHEGRWV